MARILRRRVVQMPKVASSRRNLASEINQWLKLGLNAQQIIEKMIPDDPSVTPEMMDPVFDMMALRQGATAPLAEKVDRAERLASGVLGQTPAIPVGQPSSEVPKSPSQGLGAPPRTPPGAAVPQQYLRPPPMDASVTGVPMAKVVSPEDMESTPTRANRESLIAQAVQSGDTQEQAAEWADSMLRSEAEALATRDAATEAERAQAKAKVSQSIQEAQIAENAAQLKSSFRQMFNAIKEGSGMYDFAGNVEKAVPLFLRAAQASKASSDDIQLFKLFAQKIIREQEATARGAEFDYQLKAREEKAGRLLKARGAEYDRRFDKQAGKDQLGYERRARLNIFNALLKDDGLPVPARRAIERQMKARHDLAEARTTLDETKKLFKDGQAGIDKALAEIQATGRAPSEYQESLERYLPALINYRSAKAGVDELEKLVQEYAQTSGSFIPPLKALNAKVGAELKRAGADSRSKIEKIRKAAEAAGIVISIGAAPGASKPARTRTREEIKALGEQAGSVFPPN